MLPLLDRIFRSFPLPHHLVRLPLLNLLHAHLQIFRLFQLLQRFGFLIIQLLYRYLLYFLQFWLLLIRIPSPLRWMHFIVPVQLHHSLELLQGHQLVQFLSLACILRFLDLLRELLLDLLRFFDLAFLVHVSVKGHLLREGSLFLLRLAQELDRLMLHDVDLEGQIDLHLMALLRLELGVLKHVRGHVHLVFKLIEKVVDAEFSVWAGLAGLWLLCFLSGCLIAWKQLLLALFALFD